MSAPHYEYVNVGRIHHTEVNIRAMLLDNCMRLLHTLCLLLLYTVYVQFCAATWTLVFKFTIVIIECVQST
jgi:hypothetical protein